MDKNPNPARPPQYQYFVKGEFQPFFTPENAPRLLYVSVVRTTNQTYPRILHSHSDLVEVLLVTSGTGKFLIGETFYEIQAGDLLVYNSNVVHDEMFGPGLAMEAYCVGIGGLHLPDLRENALLPDSASPVFPVGDETDSLRTLYELMHEYLEKGLPGCEAVSNYLLLALLARVLRIIGAAPARPRPELSEPATLGLRIRDYMDQHYTEPLTLQSMGKALHLSPYYLAHVFKETCGYSPAQYLLRRRIGEAQGLLITTDLPISAISERVGFETQNYFNMQFSKHVGMPPTKYRQSFVGSGRAKASRREEEGKGKGKDPSGSV